MTSWDRTTPANWLRVGLSLWALGMACALSSAAQDQSFQVDPAQSTVKFTLGDVLHTVHGTFQLKSGALEFEPSSGKVSGELVVNATSGDSGNRMRDRKMKQDVLESNHYPEIIFRPDRIQGTVAAHGRSSVQVHGIFNVHGIDHEITVPAEVEMVGDHWTANVHFTIPYEKWGMKNPSTLFLRVSDSVEIEVKATGDVVRPATANSAQ